jgi:pantoate--beta-alanine ligase
MSSRNVYLSEPERAAALCLSNGLAAAQALLHDGERDPAALAQAIRREVEAEPLAHLDYAVVVDADSFDEIPGALERPARALVAARVGRPRLIDNALLEP